MVKLILSLFLATLFSCNTNTSNKDLIENIEHYDSLIHKPNDTIVENHDTLIIKNYNRL